MSDVLGKFVSEFGIEIVIVIKGVDGVDLYCNGEMSYFDVLFVMLVDIIGVGDMFIGYVLVGLDCGLFVE